MQYSRYVIYSLFSLLHLLVIYAQEREYPESIKQKIRLVEDSLVYSGKTYLDIPRRSLKEYMERRNVPGVSIAVIKDFQIEWTKGWGWADVKEQIPVTPETVFGTGSISKSINAFAFLKLSQDGKIDLYEDINNLLTSWKFPYTRDKPITTYQLLSHTSGIWYHWTTTYNHGPFKPTLIKMLDRKKSPQDKSKPYVYTQDDPGLKYQYTNVGISVSQQILIDVTGMPYEDYIKQAVFDPLSMNSSFYDVDKKTYQLASGYRKNGKRVDGKYRPVVEYAAAGLWTTPTDLAKYVIELQLSQLNQSNKVLLQEATDMMFNPTQQELPHNYILYGGLGTFLLNKGNTKYFMHGGEGSGFTGTFVGSFEGGNGVVVLSNGEDPGLVRAIISRVAEVYDWKEYLLDDLVDANASIDLKALSQYTGNFKCEEDPENQVELYVENDLLYSRFEGGESSNPIFIPLSPNTFWAESFSQYSFTKMEFKQGKKGALDSFTLSNPDKTTHWVKVE